MSETDTKGPETSEGHNKRERKWTELEEHVADVIIRYESRKTRFGPQLQERCCDFCFTRRGLSTWYLRAGAYTVIPLCLFTVFLIFLVWPYLKTLSYTRATCRTTDIESLGRSTCHCGNGCAAYFPCVRVNVLYHYPRPEGYREIGWGMLHDVEFGGDCSFSPPCRASDSTNKAAVRAFEDEVRYHRFTCFVDKSQKDGYIMRSPRLNAALAVNLLLWPLLGAVIFSGVIIVMYMTCGCRFVRDSKPPAELLEYLYRVREAGKTSLEGMDFEERERLVYGLDEAAVQLEEFTIRHY